MAEHGTPRSRPAVRLRDLARQVGVHPSTVSRVLSGDPTARLSNETRQRVLRLAATTGYRPNRLARSLKTQRTYILGMVIPDITNPVFSALFRAVEDAAGAAGYSVILCNTDDSPLRLDQHLRVLGEGHVDGLLLATAHRADPSIAALREQGVPYVLLNRRRDDPGDSYVVPDDRHGAEVAVDHLAQLGHRRIAHIAGASEISTTSERLVGFRAAMARNGLPLDESLVVEGGLGEAAGARGMERLLALPADSQPTAVFVANDFAALGAMAVARRAGRRIPDDVSIVGFNDSALASRSDPPLTTVHIPLPEMGRLAAEILVEHLADRASGDKAPTQVVVPTELVARGTTAPMRRAARS